MSECILFYTKLHCDESLAPSEGVEGWGGGGIGRGSPSYALCGDVPLAGYGF